MTTISSLTVFNAATINGLATLSAATVSNLLTVGGNISAGAAVTTISSLNVLNAATISGLATLSAATVQNNLTVGGVSISAANATVSILCLNVSQAATITGLATLSGAIVSNLLTVGGNISAGSSLITVSAANVSNAFNVGGLATLSATTISGLLTVVGNLTAPTATITAVTLSSLAGLIAINSVSVTIQSSPFRFIVGISNNQVGTPSNVNLFGNRTGFNNSGSIVNLMGPSAGLNNTGSSVNAFGSNAALNNTGSFVNAFGCNAGSGNTRDSLNAFGANAGMGNKGVNLVAIGSNAGSNNAGDNNVSIGDWAGWNLSGASNVAVGFRSLVDNSGTCTIGIGFNAGVSGAASNCIYIGQYAGLSNTRANSIFIGSNPGYSVAANHQFVVYSLSMLPLIQGDLSFNRVGLGKAPGAFALDVSGTIQASNVSLGKLNGVTWSPSTTPGTGTVPTYTGSFVEWQIPGADAAAWSTFRATQAVNLSGYDLSGIVSFNSLSAVFVSANRRIGLGQGVLTGNTGTDVVAFGTAAGSNGSTNNMIFLGSNPGYTPAVSNAFIVYSTSTGVPFLQGDVSGRLLGIGRVPRADYALDVCGAVAASSFFTVPGAASTIGPIYICNSTVGIGAVADNPYKLDVQGILRVSNIITTNTGTSNVVGGISLSNTTLSAATVNAVTVNVNTLCAGRLLFGDVVALGSSSLSGNTGLYANALGFYAGLSNTQSNCTFIGKNPSLVSSGATLPNTFLVYSTSVAPTIQADTSNNYVGIGKVPGAYALDVSGTANVVSLSAQSVTTGIVSASAIRIINSTVVSLGSNSLSGNTAQFANALGHYAGYANTRSNCTFIGNNPSLVSSGATAPNTFLVYSTSTAAPTIQADTSNNYVGIGRVPGAYALDVSGTIRTTSSIINTINVTVINAATFMLSPTNASTYFNLVYASGCNITIALPGQTDLVRPMTYLVVGGGGGGGSRNAGGGGAGGYKTGGLTVTAGSSYTYAVTVGAGGAGGSSSGTGGGNVGGDGTGSVFSTITTGGGGGGGGGDRGSGRSGTANGGSGGGGAGRFSTNGGAATGVGTNSGGGNTSGVDGASPYIGGGGGGAGAVGGGGGAGTGAGGVGLQNNITGLYYAGGGGGANSVGGAGGQGGGGGGGTGSAEGSPGQANTGGGGGGGPFIAGNTPPPPQQAAGGAGGSGVVIISYSAGYPELVITGNLVETHPIVNGNYVYTFTSGTGSIYWGSGPTLEATTGTYWVIKNNSPINYTLNFTGGTLNTVGGPTSMYLQAGNGMTLIYSGANTVYYTF